MRKLLYILTGLLLGAGLFSCAQYEINEDVTYEPNTRISISAYGGDIGTRNFEGTDEQNARGSGIDNRIEELRVMVFRTDNGSLSFNKYITFTNPSDPGSESHVLDLRTGSYDFVFIANESSDPALSQRLASFGGLLSTLSNMSFSSDAFASALNIPMTHIERNVKILKNGNYQIGGGAETSAVWPVKLTRLGVRVDLRLETEVIEKKDNLLGVEIHNIPASVPMFANDLQGNVNTNEGSYAAMRFIAVGEGDGGGFSAISATKYRWQKERIILPSSVFDQAGDKTKGIIFKGRYSNDIAQDQGHLGPRSKAPDYYTAPRNYYYLYTGILTNATIEANLEAKPWVGNEDTWTIHNGRYLNVSQTTVNITQYNGVRVSFSSNMPKVWVSTVCYAGTTWYDNTVNTHDLFNEITDEWWNEWDGGLSRFHYDYDPLTGVGTGYMDIISQGNFTVSVENGAQIMWVGLNTNRIVLNAGEVRDEAVSLKREITINMNMTYYHDKYHSPNYVGSFHRNSEKGERIISNFGDNLDYFSPPLKWDARIGEGDFFVMTDVPSFDPKAGTDNPGDPEKFLVTDPKTYISGYGRVYFRVGMKNTRPDNADPQYGTIILSYYDWGGGKVERTFYVRQGETADYLMRPEDPITVGIMAGQPRDKASKFSPFGVTAPSFTNNYYKLAKRTTTTGGGIFTQYPTQVGAYFQWAEAPAQASVYRMAYSPSPGLVPMGYYDNSYVDESTLGYWDTAKAENETCPPGYRRPTDGITSAKTDANASVASLIHSEYRQSLFLAPPKGDTKANAYTQYGVTGYEAYHFDDYGVHNSVLGSLADGFYDRHLRSRPYDAGPEMSDLVVKQMSSEAAYHGWLFYNPTTNASVFFPIAGTRSGVQGLPIVLGGRYGAFWTASLSKAYDDPENKLGSLGYGPFLLQLPGNSPPAFMAEEANNGMPIRCVKE